MAPSPEALLHTVRACCLDPVVRRAFMQNPEVLTLLSQLQPHAMLPHAVGTHPWESHTAESESCDGADADDDAEGAPWRQLEEAVRALCTGATHAAGAAVQRLVTACRESWRRLSRALFSDLQQPSAWVPKQQQEEEEHVRVHLFPTPAGAVLVDLEVTAAAAAAHRRPAAAATAAASIAASFATATEDKEDATQVVMEAVMALTVVVLSLILVNRLRPV